MKVNIEYYWGDKTKTVEIDGSVKHLLCELHKAWDELADKSSCFKESYVIEPLDDKGELNITLYDGYLE